MKYTDSKQKRIANEAMKAPGNINKVCQKYGVTRYKINCWAKKYGIELVTKRSYARRLDQDAMVEKVIAMTDDGISRKDALKNIGVTKGAYDRWLDNYNSNVIERGYVSPNLHLWRPTNLTGLSF